MHWYWPHSIFDWTYLIVFSSFGIVALVCLIAICIIGGARFEKNFQDLITPRNIKMLRKLEE